MESHGSDGGGALLYRLQFTSSKTDIILDYYELCWQNVGNFIKAKILTAQYQAVRIFLVRLKGLEPSRRRTLDPKSSASTNSATSAVGFVVCFSKLLQS